MEFAELAELQNFSKIPSKPTRVVEHEAVVGLGSVRFDPLLKSLDALPGGHPVPREAGVAELQGWIYDPPLLLGNIHAGSELILNGRITLKSVIRETRVHAYDGD